MARAVRIGSLFLLVALVALSGAGRAEARAQAPPSPIVAVIDVDDTREPINPLLYGHFLELFKHWFEEGIWAELISDRKFFYPVNNQPLDPPNSRAEFGVQRWWTVGPEQNVVMDSARAYVGEHSPRILLDGSEPRGIRQEGIGLRTGRAYTGRIVLAGDPTARIEVTLAWGSGPNESQTIEIPSLTPDFRKYPLNFTAGGDQPNGEIRITGRGTGSFLIGAVSLMPADNVEGFDRQVLEIVREMGPTTLRWGGNASSNYEWRDGIGDPDLRPPRWDHAWDAVESNDVGTFEILALNRLLGSEPNIGVNAGLGDAHSAAQWVEYVNGSTDTPMGRLRAEHGHPEPFGVKWWGVGNEMYGRWQIGHMSIDHYVIKHNDFARRMRAVDPSILLVGSGATVYQMSADARTEPFAVDGEIVMPPFEFGSKLDWSGQLLTHSYEHMDYLAEHIYGTGLFAYDPETRTWPRLENVPLEDDVRRVANRVRAAAEAFHEYRERMPWLRDTDIRMAMDEWAAGGGEVERLLWTALVQNELLRHTDVFAMSAQTGFRRCFDHDQYHDPVLRACGLMFKLYTSQLGSIPVGVDGNSPQPDLPGTVGVDKPRIPSGSPTYPLDIFAALTEDREALTVVVVNPSETDRAFRLELEGATLPDNGRKWSITPPSRDAVNLAGRDPMIHLTESEVTGARGILSIAPYSVELYRFPLR